MGELYFDTLISGVTAFLPDPMKNAYIGIKDGKIVYVDQQRPSAVIREEIESGGLFLLPGLIDSHVHFRTPGLEHKEDYAHGTRAAVAGGVTTILDMPNTKPATDSRQLLQEKEQQTQGHAFTDYGFHFLLTKDNRNEIESLIHGEVASVKVFMAGHETAPHTVYDVTYLKEIATLLKQRGIMMTVHAEYQPLLGQREYATPEDYSRLRTREAAIEAVRLLIEIARETGCHIHVVHASTQEEVQLLLAAKKEGVPVTIEVIHPHLMLREEDLHEKGWLYKLSPPLRKQADVECLWNHVLAGEIDSIGSDHAPHTLQEKQGTPPPAGMPGVQEMFSALFTGLMTRTHDSVKSCERIAELVAKRPAQLFGLTDKGQIQIGYDADLVLFDPLAIWEVTPSSLWSKCEWSPYQHMKLRGEVMHTMLRGRTVYRHGECAEVPSGRFLCKIHQR